MKYKFFSIVFVFFTSCSILYPNRVSFDPAHFNYENITFVTKLDYTKGRYLLAKTSYEGLNSGININYIHDFFKSKLKNDVLLVSKLRNSEGKYKIPFAINYDTAFENIDFISKTVDFEFLILTKMTYLKDSKDIIANSRKQLGNDAKSGAISSIKVLDLENKKVLLEMHCSGYVDIKEGDDIGTANIYSDSNSLGDRTMKKLLKKLK